jgi:lysozyme
VNGIEIALALIRHFESCRLKAYVFPGEHFPTIGWGHALSPGEENTTITQEQADELLDNDLDERMTDLKRQLAIEYSKLTAGQLGATLSFKYNCKPVLFNTSRFLHLIRKGDLLNAQAEFKRWIHGENNVVLEGLVRRRKCEEFVFAGGSVAELISLNWFL